MWDDDWDLLGIEPTTELKAIKKAYAARLKVTRPDDDAEAYQALRNAYERAQQWAAQAHAAQAVQALAPAASASATQVPHEEAPPPGAPPPAPELPPLQVTTPEPPLPVAQRPAPPADEAAPPVDPPSPTGLRPVPPPAPQPLTKATTPELPVVQPQGLIDMLERAWRQEREFVLMVTWEDVKRLLDEQPLARRAEFSSAFAAWLAQRQQLPTCLAAALDAHFNWRSDFRTERLLGPALMHALQATLDERLPRPADPALRALADPLLRLIALRKAGRSVLLHLMLTMMHPTLAKVLDSLSAAQLRQLGLQAYEQSWLRQCTTLGFELRIGGCVALLAATAIAGLAAGKGFMAINHAFMWMVWTGLALALGVFLGALVNTGPCLTYGGRRIALPLAAWRRRPMQPMLGLLWLLCAAWLLYLQPADAADLHAGTALGLLLDWAWAGAALAVAGTFGAWPPEPLHGRALATLAPLVGYLLNAALGEWLPLGSCVCLGLAWMLWAAAVFGRRLPGPSLVPWLCWPMMNTLTLIERWSYSVAMLPLAAVIAWATLQEGQVRATTIFAIWMLGQIAVARGQAWLDQLALLWMPALPESPDARGPQARG